MSTPNLPLEALIHTLQQFGLVRIWQHRAIASCREGWAATCVTPYGTEFSAHGHKSPSLAVSQCLDQVNQIESDTKGAA